MKKIPVIIDCDPGIDDALALLMLYKYKEMFDVKLITSCSGNTPIEITTKNIQFFAENFFNGVKIAKGIGHALVKENEELAQDVHGFGGLGDYEIGEQTYPYSQDAVKEIYNTLMNSQEKIIIIAIGPLTNIGKLIKCYPECVTKIEKIYSMIGSINGIGNIRPNAEFNAFYDPEAFGIVSESGVPMVLNPMELGHNSRIKKTVFAERETKNDIHKMIKEMISGLYEFRDPTLVSIFDLHSIYALIKPKLYEFTPCDINVSISKEEYGKCIMTENINGIHKYYLIKDINECNNQILDDLFSIE